MSFDGITGSANAAALRGADAVSRPGGVLSTLATRPRGNPLDAFLIAGRPGSQRSQPPSDQQPDNASTPSSGGQADDGRTSSRTSTAFITQSLAQEQDTASPPSQASQISAGLRAYARSVGATTTQGNEAIEVIPPQLSSGHALDLSV